MCGRFALTISAKALSEVFETASAPDHIPRFNIAPTQTVPVVRLDDQNQRRWIGKRWGLVPFWAKELKIGARMINARSETARSKPAFRAAVKKRRCLIPCDGFYEWKKQADGKQPFFIHHTDASCFAFGGLWERWKDPDGGLVETCTILTTAANEALSDLHERMPVVLDESVWPEWLAVEALPEARWNELCRPSSSEPWEIFPVTRRVNTAANDDSACLDRMI